MSVWPVCLLSPGVADRGHRKEVALSTVPLPDDPSIEQLRKQAKELRDLARAGVAGALELVAAHHLTALTR
jgi:hypothetical protein